MAPVQKKKLKPLLILASTSPRRRELLKPYFRLKILAPNISEKKRRDESPRRYVQRMAFQKWKAIAPSLKTNDIVLAADTIVKLSNQILGKAKNRNHARRILKRLSGKTHEVLTAVVVGTPSRWRRCLVVSKVRFRDLRLEEIEAYLHTQEWKGKAGAYGIQGRASRFAQNVEGSLTNIIGLPVRESVLLVKKFSQRSSVKV